MHFTSDCLWVEGISTKGNNNWAENYSGKLKTGQAKLNSTLKILTTGKMHRKLQKKLLKCNCLLIYQRKKNVSYLFVRGGIKGQQASGSSVFSKFRKRYSRKHGVR